MNIRLRQILVTITSAELLLFHYTTEITASDQSHLLLFYNIYGKIKVWLIEEAFRNGSEVELVSEVDGKDFTTRAAFTQISRYSSPFEDGHTIVQALGAIVSPTNTDPSISVEFNLDEHNTPTYGSFMKTTKIPED